MLQNAQARQRCKELLSDADLLSIRDEGEQRLMEQYLTGKRKTGDGWVGLEFGYGCSGWDSETVTLFMTKKLQF